jgi:hypothetical protein
MTNTMRAALKNLLTQTLAGEGDDLSVSGIRQPTLLALQTRGFIRLVDFRTTITRTRGGRQNIVTTYRVVADSLDQFGPHRGERR